MAAVEPEVLVVESTGDLYAQFGPVLWRTAVLLTGDRDGAEDLVVEAFARALPRIESGSVEHPRAYLRVTLVNLAGARRRRLRLGRSLATRYAPAGESVDDRSDDVVAADRLAGALASLPVRQRAVVVLRYLDDLSERETAEILGVSVGTVKSQAARALAALRAQLAEEDGR